MFVAQVPVPWNTQIDGEEVPDTPSGVRDTGEKVPDTAGKVPDTVSSMPDTAGKVPDIAEKLSDVQQTVYRYVLVHGRVSTDEISSLLGVQLRRAREVLSELVESGLMQRVGAARSTRYVIADNQRRVPTDN